MVSDLCRNARLKKHMHLPEAFETSGVLRYLLVPTVEATMADAPQYGLHIRSDGSMVMGQEGMPTMDSGLAAILASVMKVVNQKAEEDKADEEAKNLLAASSAPASSTDPCVQNLVKTDAVDDGKIAGDQDDKDTHVPSESSQPKPKKKQNKRKKGRKA